MPTGADGEEGGKMREGGREKRERGEEGGNEGGNEGTTYLAGKMLLDSQVLGHNDSGCVQELLPVLRNGGGRKGGREGCE